MFVSSWGFLRLLIFKQEYQSGRKCDKIELVNIPDLFQIEVQLSL